MVKFGQTVVRFSEARLVCLQVRKALILKLSLNAIKAGYTPRVGTCLDFYKSEQTSSSV